MPFRPLKSYTYNSETDLHWLSEQSGHSVTQLAIWLVEASERGKTQVAITEKLEEPVKQTFDPTYAEKDVEDSVEMTYEEARKIGYPTKVQPMCINEWDHNWERAKEPDLSLTELAMARIYPTIVCKKCGEQRKSLQPYGRERGWMGCGSRCEPYCSGITHDGYVRRSLSNEPKPTAPQPETNLHVDWEMITGIVAIVGMILMFALGFWVGSDFRWH